MVSKNYLISGGAGFVGSVLTQSLINEGHHVKVVDKFFFDTKFEKNDNLSILKKDARALVATAVCSIRNVRRRSYIATSEGLLRKVCRIDTTVIRTAVIHLLEGQRSMT